MTAMLPESPRISNCSFAVSDAVRCGSAAFSSLRLWMAVFGFRCTPDCKWGWIQNVRRAPKPRRSGFRTAVRRSMVEESCADKRQYGPTRVRVAAIRSVWKRARMQHPRLLSPLCCLRCSSSTLFLRIFMDTHPELSCTAFAIVQRITCSFGGLA